MNRRCFLAAGLALAGSPLARAEAVGLPEPAFSLLAAAARAPSSHNSQPWRLSLLSPWHWRLCPEPGRRLAVVDPDGRELWLSLGAFVAALGVAAASRGLSLEREDSEGSATELKLSTGARTDIPVSALMRRSTLRRDLAPVPGLAAAWTGLAGGDKNLHFVPFASAAGREIANATFKANARQVELDPVWQELADWIRWRPSELARNPTGLTAETMELPWLVRQWVSATYSREDVLTRAFRLRGLDLVGQQLREGEGWLVVTGDTDSRRDWLAAGEALMRFWLHAVPASLALHPMSQALEFADARRTLEQSLGLGRIQFVARLGRRAYPDRAIGPRLSPTSFARMS